MATLSVRKVTDSGVNPDSPAWDAAAGGGDDFPNNGLTWVHIANGGGAGITVTIPLGIDPHANDPLHSTTNTTVSITNGEAKVIGPFDKVKYGNSVSVAYSGVTSVTVAAFSL